MSSRNVISTGEGLPSSRHGERTPLRSLGNDMQYLSTPSHQTKSKSLLSVDDLNTAQGDVPLFDSGSHMHSPAKDEIENNAPVNDTRAAEDTCELRDVTLKSFLFTGSEVEISDPSACAEESFVLANDQVIKNTCEKEDTVGSISMIMQSCSEHIEHPYHKAEIQDVSLVDKNTACLHETPSTTVDSELDDKCTSQDSEDFQNDCCGETHTTWKSLISDGGEVEISQVTMLQSNIIPVPRPQLPDSSQDNLNSLNLADCDQLYQADHASNLYSSRNGISVISTLSESPNSSDKGVNVLSNVTFKSFNCTGGEIEILDGTKLGEETVPLPVNHIDTCSYDVNASILVGDHALPNCKDHSDHPYCNIENNSTSQNGKNSTALETLQHISDVMDEVERSSSVVLNNHTGTLDRGLVDSAGHEVENSECAHLIEKTSPLSKDKTVLPPYTDVVPICVAKGHIQEDCNQPSCHAGKEDNEDMQETSKYFLYTEDSCLPFVGCPTPVEVPEDLKNSDSCETSPESTEGKDSALGSTGNGPVCISEEKPSSENLGDVLKVLSECPSVASALQLEVLSPILRRVSLSTQKAKSDPIFDQFLGDDSALHVDKTFAAPSKLYPAGLWAEQLESPMPRPLFNSTALGCNPRSVPTTETDDVHGPLVMPQSKVEKPGLDIPVIQDGPLQQQLRQMAEFLMLALGTVHPTAVSASSARPNPVETQSVCVGTTSVRMVDHSLNTSGQFERKREFSVADSCTLTDPLLWNVPPGSLECLPRQELEQRLASSMIMVEALVQQLAAARVPRCPSAGPAPSELREKLVQTDHTELNQTTMYRDLYMEALSRISQLELDGHLQQNLIQSLQDMRVTMTSLSSDTEAALSNILQIGDFTRGDHQSLVSHYGQMKSLLKKTKETQKGMVQKVKDALQQRNDMKTQMEEAFTAKEAAFSAMGQLRTHCATQISELETCVGSQQELLAALNQAHPEEIALNQAFNETLNVASDLLNQTMKDHSSLMNELCTVKGLVKKTAPMLVNLKEKAAAALRERDEHASAREQAIEEREQMEEELNQANMDLQTAREQICDLNLQVTILTSEMGVLRQKLTEHEEERGQLERKVTELSATVSSSLASYTFLEQALASETTKLQQSWKDVQQAKDRANEFEMSLGQSEQRVSELSQSLVQSEEQLRQLQTLSQAQKEQIQQLQDLCKQLSGVQEMNEFLQMENELAREQMSESEHMLRANLQGLRERNIECEDLRGELGQLQLQNRKLQEQLEATRCRGRATQLELEEKLSQTVTDITLLHHTLRGLTNELQAALCDQKPEASKDVHIVERRHPSSSLVDSVIVALTNKEEDIVNTGILPEPDIPKPQCEALFSETSAFTRIAVITPKKNVNAVELGPEEDEHTSAAELLADLSSTVAELVDTVNLVRQRKDAQLEELHSNICGLQREQQAANSRHEAEVFGLKHQLQQLNSLVEKGQQALQQKAQDEKTVAKLMADLKETHEILNKHKTDSNELMMEVAELRRSLQQSKVESQFLRKELIKTGGQSATPAQFMEEKIQLLKEMERLKLSLCEVEQARVKLLERAKRHQMIHQTNQLKSETELQMLNNMINNVRKTLLSLPEGVKNCEQIRQLVEYLG
ncbi:sperm-associated antigen 5 [Betta splendens]|uniref:Sperm-associated antigen 5 n=1 Tax=Betta splendens TaxID=158456 RepID=A0A6P7N6H2_BETSP|nr:sperm-associated antigen 5 [Betta splendens]XP_029013976.1 sperm-associated antigen 5 [Betta splendens]